MTEEQAVYRTEIEDSLREQLKQAGDTIGRLTDRIKEVESDNLELEYKLATMYEMLHGRKPKNDVRDS